MGSKAQSLMFLLASHTQIHLPHKAGLNFQSMWHRKEAHTFSNTTHVFFFRFVGSILFNTNFSFLGKWVYFPALLGPENGKRTSLHKGETIFLQHPVQLNIPCAC